jgi:hypothetical protein
MQVRDGFRRCLLAGAAQRDRRGTAVRVVADLECSGLFHIGAGLEPDRNGAERAGRQTGWAVVGLREHSRI